MPQNAYILKTVPLWQEGRATQLRREMEKRNLADTACRVPTACAWFVILNVRSEYKKIAAKFISRNLCLYVACQSVVELACDDLNWYLIFCTTAQAYAADAYVMGNLYYCYNITTCC